MATDAPRSRLPVPAPRLLPAERDLAKHHEASEPGPGPAVRAVIGLLLGVALGIAGALLTPRRNRRQATRDQ